MLPTDTATGKNPQLFSFPDGCGVHATVRGLSCWARAALVAVVLAAAGCGRTQLDAFQPAGGRRGRPDRPAGGPGRRARGYPARPPAGFATRRPARPASGRAARHGDGPAARHGDGLAGRPRRTDVDARRAARVPAAARDLQRRGRRLRRRDRRGPACDPVPGRRQPLLRRRPLLGLPAALRRLRAGQQAHVHHVVLHVLGQPDLLGRRALVRPLR